MAYVKVWFGRPPYAAEDVTAGLIFDYDKIKSMSIEDVSRCFPMRESVKMHKIFRSPQFPTWDEAFAFRRPMDVS